MLSGIGNAYSNEILHVALLSPLASSQKLKDEQWQRLYHATRSNLQLWVDRLREEAVTGFRVRPRRPRRQTGGNKLSDRGLSRLLKSDAPRTIDEAIGYRYRTGSSVRSASESFPPIARNASDMPISC